MSTTSTRLTVSSVALLAALGCKKRQETPPPIAAPTAPEITHGVAAGEVTGSGALLWARSDRAATLEAVVSTGGAEVARSKTTVTAAEDFTGVIRIESLRPGTAYDYSITATADGLASEGATGRFRTAPSAETRAPVRFLWSGDLAGQNACRDATQGFPIFTPINATPMDFFVPLGDMVYADGVCKEVGLYGNKQVAGSFDLAADLASFWAHWKYNRDDPGLRRLLANNAVYPIWDDHEVVNDVGPKHDTRSQAPYRAGEHLLPLGRAAFLHYNPVKRDATELHSRLRWGKHLELFFLDNRSHRDANDQLDNGPTAKTMLGADQRAWLEAGLRDSDATWQVVVSSVPISIPTGSDEPLARDGWADFGSKQGFERELRAILTAAAAVREPRLVWITTDVHFASVFRYQPLADKPTWRFHEFVVGPLSAGLYPTRDFDKTFATESLFFHGPKDATALDFEAAQTFMTYGAIAIAADGSLVATIHDARGTELHRTRLMP